MSTVKRSICSKLTLKAYGSWCLFSDSESQGLPPVTTKRHHDPSRFERFHVKGSHEMQSAGHMLMTSSISASGYSERSATSMKPVSLFFLKTEGQSSRQDSQSVHSLMSMRGIFFIREADPGRFSGQTPCRPPNPLNPARTVSSYPDRSP